MEKQFKIVTLVLSTGSELTTIVRTSDQKTMLEIPQSQDADAKGFLRCALAYIHEAKGELIDGNGKIQSGNVFQMIAQDEAAMI
jgi:hypothetical protein